MALPVNLLIADDHELITDGISKLLEQESMINKIYIAHNGLEAVQQVLNNDIDCVIMDINMPELNGLGSTKKIIQQKPDVKIIVVSMLNDASIVSRMLKAGAHAFIGKDTGKAELLLALNKVMLGEKYVSPRISTHLITHLTDKKVAGEPGKVLTPRELEILSYIVNGFTNQEIAQKLFLSTVTVDTHRKNMLAKLQLKNTASLVKYAIDQNLLQ